MQSKTLYILRGTPGSGKSTLAPKLAKYVVETDDFFIDENEEYHFDMERVPESHIWALGQLHFLMNYCSPWDIAVCDAFIKLDTMKPYKELAKRKGYNVVEILVKSSFQNVHDIDESKMDEIRAEMEYSPWPDKE